MRRTAVKLGLGVVVMSAAAGCRLEPVGPVIFESDSLDVVARVEPERIGPGDTGAAVAIFRNKTEKSLTVSFGAGCPFHLEVINRDSGDQVRLEGSGYACTAAGMGWEIPAADSVIWTQPLGAMVNSVAARTGEYLARFDFTTGVPDLEASFAVK